MEVKRVAIGLSGGIDSSISAYILKKQGYNVIGLTMAIWDGSVKIASNCHTNACYGPDEEKDIEFARALCKNLNIPYYVINLKSEFKKYILNYFKSEYLNGRTPNPCIMCNSMLKFGFLINKASQLGIEFDYFATGHYARVEYSNKFKKYVLKKAKFKQKDQSYFLYKINKSLLKKKNLIFPVGEFSKSEIMSQAKKLGLNFPVYKESQDFICGKDYSVLFENDRIIPGEIVDETGKVLGTHRGIIHYTIGQRRGLKISAPYPLYVIDIDARHNRIIVGKKEALYSSGLIADNLNWLLFDKLDKPMNVTAKIRLKHNEAEATVYPETHNTVRLIFKQKQLSITKGQSVVFYIEDIVVGGGTIKEIIN